MASTKNYLWTGLAVLSIAAAAGGIAAGVTRSHYVRREQKLNYEFASRENERIGYCQEQGFMNCRREDLTCMQKTFHDPHTPTLGTYQRLDNFNFRRLRDSSGDWGF